MQLLRNYYDSITTFHSGSFDELSTQGPKRFWNDSIESNSPYASTKNNGNKEEEICSLANTLGQEVIVTYTCIRSFVLSSFRNFLAHVSLCMVY